MIERIEEDGEYVVCFNGEIRCIKHGETPFNITLPQELELMQSTGMFDKNSKEIFEGDILSGTSDRAYVVTFHDGCFDLNCAYIDDQTFLSDTREVVGNIYENPEIL